MLLQGFGEVPSPLVEIAEQRCGLILTPSGKVGAIGNVVGVGNVEERDRAR